MVRNVQVARSDDDVNAALSAVRRKGASVQACVQGIYKEMESVVFLKLLNIIRFFIVSQWYPALSMSWIDGVARTLDYLGSVSSLSVCVRLSFIKHLLFFACMCSFGLSFVLRG